MMGGVRRPCPVCGGAAANPLFDNAMAPIGGLDMSYTVCECAQCGFVFAGVLPPEEQYAAYYARLSKYDFSSAISPVDAARGRAARELIVEAFDVSATVVDVGCGNGALLSMLKDAGFHNLHGVDPAPNAGAKAQQAFGLSGVRHGSMADSHRLVPLGEADVVLVMAVLEHLWDPARDLGKLLRHMRPGSRVIVEVPALETFDADRGEPFGELSLEHIQFFSLASLHRFMAAIGARAVHHLFVNLASIHAQALFAMYELAEAPARDAQHDPADVERVRRYIEISSRRLDAALLRVPEGGLIIHGAGSHTARLLPRLADFGRRFHVARVVDANTNLQGTRIGAHTIDSPESIGERPHLPVLVSSYRYQTEIREQLRSRYRNEIVTLYPERRLGG